MAVKILRAELTSDPDVVARFVQERSILVDLAHPNLVGVRDLVVEGETLAIVMDLVEGSDLRAVLRQRPTLPPAEGVARISDVLQGLTAVHAAGIVHRDLKPENILVDSSKPDEVRARITDFGIARIAHGPSLTRLSGLIGTPEYMAPELAEREQATPKADLYSAGIILYEVLGGRTPFAGGHPVAVLRRHLEEDVPPLEGLPDPLWGLIARLLEKDPEARPTSAAEVADELATLPGELAGLPALAPVAPPSTNGRGSKNTRERRKPVPTMDGGTQPEDEDERGTRLGRHRELPLSVPLSDECPGRRLGPLVAVVLAVALASLGVLGAVLWRSAGGVPSSDAQLVAAAPKIERGPTSSPSGLSTLRTWTLDGERGDRLHAEVVATNTSDSPLSERLVEIIPKSLAVDVDDIDFPGGIPEIIEADPVVAFDVRDLAPGQRATFTYDIRVAPEGRDIARLKRWSEDQAAAAAEFVSRVQQEELALPQGSSQDCAPDSIEPPERASAPNRVCLPANTKDLDLATITNAYTALARPTIAPAINPEMSGRPSDAPSPAPPSPDQRAPELGRAAPRSPSPPSPKDPSPEYRDGADNDEDGYTDHPSDPACSSLDDRIEAPKDLPKTPIVRTHTANASLIGSVVAPGAPLSGSVTFDRKFEALSEVCMHFTFEEDLLDGGEELAISNFGGFLVPAGEPSQSSRTLCSPYGPDLERFMDGAEAFTLTMLTGRIQISTLRVSVSGY